MTRIACRFKNPANNVTYDWPINYDNVSSSGRSRSIEHTANTATTGLVRQQGSDDPLVFKVSGAILTEAQYQAFWEWFNRCASQTIYWRDVDNDEYEVIVTSFTPVKVRGRNRQGGVAAPLWYWKYEMEIEVVTCLTGVLADIGLVP